MITLRNYQDNSFSAISNELRKGNNPIAVLPTGAGKTVIFSYISQRIVNKGNKALILVDSEDLLRQTLDTLKQFGIKAQGLKAGHKYINQSASVYVGMILTLRKRPLLNVQLVIADECHISTFDPYLLQYRERKTPYIGFTATPWRLTKRKPLVDIYDSIVHEVDTPELIEGGFLCPAEYYGFNEESLTVSKAGEFEEKANIDYVGKCGSALENYEKFAKDTTAVIYCVNVKHTIEVFLTFLDADYSVTHIHSKMPKVQSNRNTADFKAGKYDIMVNCGILTKGFDMSAVETIIMYRATKSLALWIQIAGRGGRTQDGKDSFKIIDLGGNILRHGFWHQEREWSLKPKKYKEGLAPVKECPECLRILHASQMICKCGYQFPKPKKEVIESEVERILPISEESYKELMPLMGYQVKKDYKQGWLIRQIINKGGESLLIDWIKLKGYSPTYRKTIKRIYNI
jgi:superfamily II DNA or RNA helicase